MGRRKQSKTSWRKRGQPLEAAALDARRQMNQERRTGGPARVLDNSQLFEFDQAPEGTGGAQKPPAKELWVNRVVASNPLIPVVGGQPTLPSAKRKSSLRGKMEKFHLAATQQGRRKPTDLVSDLGIWSGDAMECTAKGRAHKGSTALPEKSTSTKAVEVAPEGSSYNPLPQAHSELLQAQPAPFNPIKSDPTESQLIPTQLLPRELTRSV